MWGWRCADLLGLAGLQRTSLSPLLVWDRDRGGAGIGLTVGVGCGRLWPLPALNFVTSEVRDWVNVVAEIKLIVAAGDVNGHVKSWICSPVMLLHLDPWFRDRIKTCGIY